MQEQQTLKCGPITARVSEATQGSWNIVIRLLEVTRRFEITAMDADTAKNAAIGYARDLCRQHKVDVPECLNSPEWAIIQKER
jgi:hypothetical protein